MAEEVDTSTKRLSANISSPRKDVIFKAPSAPPRRRTNHPTAFGKSVNAARMMQTKLLGLARHFTVNKHRPLLENSEKKENIKTETQTDKLSKTTSVSNKLPLLKHKGSSASLNKASTTPSAIARRNGKARSMSFVDTRQLDKRASQSSSDASIGTITAWLRTAKSSQPASPAITPRCTTPEPTTLGRKTPSVSVASRTTSRSTKKVQHASKASADLLHNWLTPKTTSVPTAPSSEPTRPSSSTVSLPASAPATPLVSRSDTGRRLSLDVTRPLSKPPARRALHHSSIFDAWRVAPTKDTPASDPSPVAVKEEEESEVEATPDPRPASPSPSTPITMKIAPSTPPSLCSSPTTTSSPLSLTGVDAFAARNVATPPALLASLPTLDPPSSPSPPRSRSGLTRRSVSASSTPPPRRVPLRKTSLPAPGPLYMGPSSPTLAPQEEDTLVEPFDTLSESPLETTFLRRKPLTKSLKGLMEDTSEPASADTSLSDDALLCSPGILLSDKQAPLNLRSPYHEPPCVKEKRTRVSVNTNTQLCTPKHASQPLPPSLESCTPPTASSLLSNHDTATGTVDDLAYKHANTKRGLLHQRRAIERVVRADDDDDLLSPMSSKIFAAISMSRLGNHVAIQCLKKDDLSDPFN